MVAPLTALRDGDGALAPLPLYSFMVDTWTTLKVKTTDAQLANTIEVFLVVRVCCKMIETPKNTNVESQVHMGMWV